MTGAGNSKRRTLRRGLALAVLACLPWTAGAEVGAVRYVDDVITINVREAPAGGADTIAFISSGARVVVLERDDERGFSRVRLDSGEEGWVRHQFLTAQPVARDRVAAAETEAARLRAERDAAVADLTPVRSARDDFEAQAGELAQANARLREELDEIRAVSAEALALRDRAQSLEAAAREAQQQQAQAAAAAAAAGNRLLLVGALAGIAGLAIGFYIGSMPVRREKRWARVD